VEELLAVVMVEEGVPIVTLVGSAIRLLGILASGIVLLGFALFAVDEMKRGSENQQQALASELRPETHDPALISGFRDSIDDAGEVLLPPFAGVVDSDNDWVDRGVPTVLGLLLYGLLFGLLANLLPKQREHRRDWRAAEP
jgi:hypothetical protein